MQGEKYIIDCPRCGAVEGFAPQDAEDIDTGPLDADTIIEEQEFEVGGHPVTRIRCPRCGTWLAPERARPE